MKELANKILEIIGDYRKGSAAEINQARIIKWVNQFAPDDREFLLTELLHILPKSYISQKKAIDTLGGSFEYLKNKYGHKSIEDFLFHAKFLSCQQPHKSQTKLLEFLETQAEDELEFDFSKCGTQGEKYWIYFDDVLASGGTFRKEITYKINHYGLDKFKEENIKIIAIFFFLHSWGSENSRFTIQCDLGENVANRIDFHRVHEIENHPRINFYNPKPSFNHVFPKKNDESWDEYLENLEADRHREFAYRPKDKPDEEKFYTSPENRDRYEQILLNKGIKIFNKITHVSEPVRPLGFTSPSYKTFGTGSHAFTWRNISNTCPLVYWWESNGWIPLFSVNNRGI